MKPLAEDEKTNIQAKKTFYCKLMKCTGVTVIQCIRRHISEKTSRSVFGATYSACFKCPEGAKKKENYPEVYALALKWRSGDKSQGIKKKNSQAKTHSLNAGVSQCGTFETFYRTEPGV